MLLGSALPVSAHTIARTDTSPQLAAPANLDCTYVVRPGDDLFRIALRFGTTSFMIALMNGIANPNFFSGQLSFDSTRVTNGSTGRVELADISARWIDDCECECTGKVLVLRRKMRM